jgi:hypothetical protein
MFHRYEFSFPAWKACAPLKLGADRAKDRLVREKAYNSCSIVMNFTSRVEGVKCRKGNEWTG